MSKLVLKGKNIDITSALREFVESKLAKLDKYSQHIVEISVELHVEKNPRISDNNIVMVNIFANGAVIRGEEASPDMYASIDMVLDKLERQLKKYEKTRIQSSRKQKTSMAVAEMANINNENVEEEQDDFPQYSGADEKYMTY